MPNIVKKPITINVPVGIERTPRQMPSVPSLPNLLKLGRRVLEDMVHLRIANLPSVADTVLSTVGKYRYYQYLPNNGAAKGLQGGVALSKMLPALGLQTINTSLIRVIVKTVDERQFSMGQVEANFFPVWPSNKAQPKNPGSPDFIGCIFYGANQNWYLVINQKNLGKFMLGPKFPNVRYADLDPLSQSDSDSQRTLMDLRNDLGQDRNGQLFDRMVINLLPSDELTQPNDQDYIDPDLKWYRGNGMTFRPIDRYQFNQVVESYVGLVWQLWKNWKQPVHKLSLFDPKVNADPDAAHRHTASEPPVPQIGFSPVRMMAGDKPLLSLPAPSKNR